MAESNQFLTLQKGFLTPSMATRIIKAFNEIELTEHAQKTPSSSPVKHRIARSKPKRIKAEEETSDSPVAPPPRESAFEAFAAAGEETRLFFMTMEEAENYSDDRVPLGIPSDDLADVVNDPHRYVLLLVNAFKANVIDHPAGSALDDHMHQGWQQFQDTHVTKVSNALRHDLRPLEVCAWQLYTQVIEIHTHGVHKTLNVVPDRKLVCSARMDTLVTAIEDYAIIRYDMIRQIKMDEFVAAPTNYIARKITNWKNNQNKTRRDEENAAEAAKVGVRYSKVLGNASRSPPKMMRPISRPVKKEKSESGSEYENSPTKRSRVRR